jgi:ubiquinone biosynthesis protein
MRGKPVKELSVGQMLDGLFAITRDFDMQTQPHLLLLQKTMVMVEGIATQLNEDINMWDTAAPYVREWIRDELGPEAAVAERIKEDTDTLLRLPGLIRRIEDKFPPKGGAPEPAPLPEIKLITERSPGSGGGWIGYFVAGLAGAGAMWAAASFGLL